MILTKLNFVVFYSLKITVYQQATINKFTFMPGIGGENSGRLLIRPRLIGWPRGVDTAVKEEAESSGQQEGRKRRADTEIESVMFE